GHFWWPGVAKARCFTRARPRCRSARGEGAERVHREAGTRRVSTPSIATPDVARSRTPAPGTKAAGIASARAGRVAGVADGPSRGRGRGSASFHKRGIVGHEAAFESQGDQQDDHKTPGTTRNRGDLSRW